MIETYYAGAYWPARQESAEQCARRAQKFFHAMARCDPFFSRWFVPRTSRKQAPKPFEPEVPTLQRMFEQDRNRNDEGRAIEDLGFGMMADNGRRPEKQYRGHHSFLSITCGVYAEPVSNVCVLDLPYAGPDADRILSAPVLVEVLRAMALAWEPDWGVVTSQFHRDEVLKKDRAGPFVGWVMYFSRALDTFPPLPAPVRLEPVEDRGTILLLTPERFTATNAEHVALAAQVMELLERAGMLEPIRPQ